VRDPGEEFPGDAAVPGAEGVQEIEGVEIVGLHVEAPTDDRDEAAVWSAHGGGHDRTDGAGFSRDPAEELKGLPSIRRARGKGSVLVGSLGMNLRVLSRKEKPAIVRAIDDVVGPGGELAHPKIRQR